MEQPVIPGHGYTLADDSSVESKDWQLSVGKCRFHDHKVLPSDSLISEPTM